MPHLISPNIQKLQENRDVKGLINALDFPEETIRDQAADALASMAPFSLKPIRQALQNSSVNIRCGAARALSRIRIPEAIPVMSEGLKNPIRFVRLDCVRGLGGTRDKSAIEVLKKHLLQETDPEIQMSVYESLVYLGNQDAALKLFSHLENPDHNLRMAASQSLTRLGNIVLDLLLLGLSKETVATRFACANIFGAYQSPKAMIPLIQTLADPDEGVQKAAQEALIKYEPSPAHLLVKALRTKNQRLQKMVIRTLEKIPDSAEKSLIEELPFSDLELCELILQILGRIGKSGSIRPIGNLIHNSSASIRYAAVNALSAIGLEDAVVFLSKALEDGDQYVSSVARTGLQRIAQTSNNPELIRQVTLLLKMNTVDESSLNVRERIKNMIEELVQISNSDGFIGESGGNFDSLSRHRRAREIGIELYKIGGHRLMQSVLGTINNRLGDSRKSADLITNWKEIGGWNAG